MISWKRNLKVVGPALLLVIVFLGSLLSVSGYGETLRFVFIADSRAPKEVKDSAINTKALDDLNEQILNLSPKPAFVIYGGDIASYGINDDGSNNFVPFKALMKKLTDKHIELYLALGNHELYKQEKDYWKKLHLTAQQKYQEVFADLPDDGPSGYKKLVYSFESPGGDAFFAILDPYYLSDGPPEEREYNPGVIDATQLKWLLEKIGNTRATHKFLCMHTPVYPVIKSDMEKGAPTSSDKLWDILANARFDLFLCGHEHLYSRKAIDSNIKPDKPWKNQVVQLINGGGGAPAYDDAELGRDRKDWHIDVEYGKFFYTVVDINDKQVTVSTYKGSDCKYSLNDQFTIQENGKAERPGK